MREWLEMDCVWVRVVIDSSETCSPSRRKILTGNDSSSVFTTETISDNEVQGMNKSSTQVDVEEEEETLASEEEESEGARRRGHA